MSPFLLKWLETKPLSKRLKDAQTVQKKYADRIPIVVGPARESSPTITAHKYLVPNDLTMGQFLQMLRLRIHIKPEQALFVFITDIDGIHPDVLVSVSDIVSHIYAKYKNGSDGFLYMVYDVENTFGGE